MNRREDLKGKNLEEDITQKIRAIELTKGKEANETIRRKKIVINIKM